MRPQKHLPASDPTYIDSETLPELLRVISVVYARGGMSMADVHAYISDQAHRVCDALKPDHFELWGPRADLAEAARAEIKPRVRMAWDRWDKLRASIFERDGWSCLRCGATDRLSVDHIVPISKGGSDAPDNLQTLCLSCNSSKGTAETRFTNCGPR